MNSVALGLTCNFLSYHILSFRQISQGEVKPNESVDLLLMIVILLRPCYIVHVCEKVNTGAELRLCLDCVAFATGCPDSILGSATKCCERVNHLVLKIR